jgi:PPM family protein phosphatase
MSSLKSLTIEAYGDTDVGRVRPANQDAFLCLPEEGAFIVADGMGGHAGGEVASMLCILAIQTFMQSAEALSASRGGCEHPCQPVMQALSDAVNHAALRIYERACEEPSLKGMGTTVTMLKFVADYGYFAHVGDSRLYLLRQGALQQLTTDHSWVNEQIQAGLLSREEAASHPFRNIITRSVGYREEVDVDTGCIELCDDDCLLLCSDGLHGYVSHAEIARLLIDGGTYAVRPLIDLANERGGEDNITVLVVKVQVSS